MLTTRSARPDTTMTMIEVIRPFAMRGERQEVGAKIEVEKNLARELIHNNKAVAVPPAALPAEPEAETTAEAAPESEQTAEPSAETTAEADAKPRQSGRKKESK